MRVRESLEILACRVQREKMLNVGDVKCLASQNLAGVPWE